MTGQTAADPYDLERFLTAQAKVWPRVVRELASGRKRSHWMWFVFPQLAGLGRSTTARFYAIGSLAEARAYLGHAVLGTRLRECTRLVLGHSGQSLHAIFGSPDDLKFRSSMTLFAAAATDEPLFAQALATFCNDLPDGRTLELLAH